MITQTMKAFWRWILFAALLSGMQACATPRAISNPETTGDLAASVAMRQVGVPYRYGGNTPEGFDCSGLVQFAYAQAGKSVPRTTRSLWAATKKIEIESLQRGDLLFFEFGGKVSHVAIFISPDRFVHAPSTGRFVTVDRLSAPIYQDALVRVARPL